MPRRQVTAIEWLDEELCIVTVRVQSWPWNPWYQRFIGRYLRWKDLDTDVRVEIALDFWLGAVWLESRQERILAKMSEPPPSDSPKTLKSTRKL